MGFARLWAGAGGRTGSAAPATRADRPAALPGSSLRYGSSIFRPARPCGRASPSLCRAGGTRVAASSRPPAACPATPLLCPHGLLSRPFLSLCRLRSLAFLRALYIYIYLPGLFARGDGPADRLLLSPRSRRAAGREVRWGPPASLSGAPVGPPPSAAGAAPRLVGPPPGGGPAGRSHWGTGSSRAHRLSATVNGTQLEVGCGPPLRATRPRRSWCNAGPIRVLRRPEPASHDKGRGGPRPSTAASAPHLAA